VSTNSALGADWLAACHLAGHRVRAALGKFATLGERSAEHGRGEGGDMTLAVDRAAEDAVIQAFEALGRPLTLLSEERGTVELSGGGGPLVVVDPIDGSKNARRGLPFFCLSIAVAEGRSSGDIVFGYVLDLGSQEEWWAERGGGAFRDGLRLECDPDARLEMVGLETARPELLASCAEAIGRSGAARLRTLGSVALSICWIADRRLDAMTSLRPVRVVDFAAAQLVLREAGGAFGLPEGDADAAPLDLEFRARVAGGATPELLARAAEIGP
jgi:myo-inositol-1(or 4)-monophosphatase